MRYPLSPIELSFWYQYKFDPVSDANNIVHRLVFSKVYDISLLEQSLNLLISHHEILQSNFNDETGVPYRTINSRRSLKVINRNKQSLENILNNIKKPFILESDNLIRVIFTTSGLGSTLYIACPHIIFDAQSWNIFMKELLDILDGKQTHHIDFVSYAKPDENAQKYWYGTLNDIEGRVSFQQNTSLKNITNSAAIIESAIPSFQLEALTQIGITNNFSMNSLCLAILSVALYKITGDQKMIIATPVTMRDESSTNSIGAYINVIPVIAILDSNKTFIELAKDISNQIWGGLENRNYSLIELTSQISQGHYSDNQGIYNVMAEYVPEQPDDQPLVKDEIITNNYAKQDFTLSLISKSGSNQVNVEYDSSKLDPIYVKKIVETFSNVISQIVQKPEIIIKKITAVDSETAQELIELGAGPSKKILPPYVWNRFKALVAKYGDEVAVIEETRSITYKQLFRMACRNAGELAAIGAGKGTVVGLNMERKADYIASMLAIWSIGAIYVPLDTKQPSNRLKLMIDKAKISIVMTDHDRHTFDNVVLHNINELDQATSFFDSEYEPSADDTAYIIFTSGSTGTPKGVMIEHKGFLNHLEIMINELQLEERVVIAQTAPVSFDISVWQLVGALMIGGSIRVVSYDDMVDPEKLYKVISSDQISVLEVVPSLLSAYLAAEDINESLRKRLKNVQVITTGEAINATVVRQWVKHYPDQRLLNAYGPAEVSDDTHFYNITSDNFTTNTIPIGKPLQNIRTYILDKDLQLSPKGVVGEICIGGHAVAKGYVDDELLTSQVFVVDPYENNKNFRLYRTGDYGRWGQNNLLEFHGRRDSQVKVRGQRLELEEVESKLNALVGVKHAAVVIEETSSGSRLIGYIVPQSKTVNLNSIKKQLRSSLPDYMIPWEIVLNNELPKNANGKLDRRALRKMYDHQNPQSHSRNEDTILVKRVTEIYSHVLGRQVEADANYFDCGGDSLQSMRIVALLSKSNIEVTVRDILTHQTPRELAEMANLARKKKHSSGEEWEPLKGYTPIQEHYLKVTGDKYQENGEIQAAIIKIQCKSKLTNNRLQQALNQLILAHGSLRPVSESRALVVNISKGKTTDENISVIRNKLSLKTPLIGCILSHGKSARVLLIAHHLVLDFQSMNIIQRELSTIVSNSENVKHENILQKWWGNAEKELSENTTEFAKTHYWKNILRSYIPIARERRGKALTKFYSFSQPINQTTIKELAKQNISIENFTYFIIAKAHISLFNENVFHFNIESSIRSLARSSMLSQAVGWMGYLFPQRIDGSLSLLEFNKQMSHVINESYSYGLLRYKTSPAQFDLLPEPVWTINYIGKQLHLNHDIEFIKTVPLKERAFAELAVRIEQNKLIFEIYHNTMLEDNDLDKFSLLVKSQIKQELMNLKDVTDNVEISSARKQAIIERVRNAR